MAPVYCVIMLNNNNNNFKLPFGWVLTGFIQSNDSVELAGRLDDEEEETDDDEADDTVFTTI